MIQTVLFHQITQTRKEKEKREEEESDDKKLLKKKTEKVKRTRTMRSSFCLVGFLTSSSTTRLYHGRASRQSV